MEEDIKQKAEQHPASEQQPSQQSQSSCETELHQAMQRLMYLTAEFDNYKKRTEKERVQWISSGQDAVLLNLLSVMDTVERALDQIDMQQVSQEAQVHLEGFKLLEKELQKILKTYDVTPMTCDTFDPELHEALMNVNSSDHASGSIVQIFEKGYLRKGVLLRPAKVSVAE